MDFVTIRKNGVLVCSDSSDRKTFDVSERAIEYLFEPCKLGRGIVLKDLFLLMQKNPTLIDVFSRYGARDQVDNALSVHEEPITVDKSPASVEYLELYKIVDGPWDDKYEVWPWIRMNGIGYAFSEDTEIDGHIHSTGSRIPYTMVGSPPSAKCKFASLPRPEFLKMVPKWDGCKK